MLRATSASFNLASVNGQALPIFSSRPRPFADPFEQRWFFTFQSPPLGEKETFAPGSGSQESRRRPSYREARARIIRLRGTAGKVRLFDPTNYRPYRNLVTAATKSNWSDGSTFSDGSQWVSGYLPPVITVDEAAEAGAESVVVRGLPASISAVMRMGDPFEGIPGTVRPEWSEYHSVVEDATSNASGKTRLYFQPTLRGALNAGDPIRLKYPTAVFALLDDKQGEMQNEMFTGSFGSTFVEVLPFD
jgi:hypothetical protein